MWISLLKKQTSTISWVFSTCHALSVILCNISISHHRSQGGWNSQNRVRDQEIEVYRGEAICPRSDRQQAPRVRLWKPTVSMMLSQFTWTSHFLIWWGKISCVRRTTAWRLTNGIYSMDVSVCNSLGFKQSFSNFTVYTNHLGILWMQILNQQVGETWSGAQDAYF